MKIIYYISFLAIATLVLISSCTKKTPEPPAFSPSFTLTVDSSTPSGLAVQAKVVSDSLIINGGQLTDADGLIVTITVSLDIKKGTYPVGPGISLSMSGFTGLRKATSGAVVIITNSDNIISGTYSGTVSYSNGGSSSNISGTFSTKY